MSRFLTLGAATAALLSTAAQADQKADSRSKAKASPSAADIVVTAHRRRGMRLIGADDGTAISRRSIDSFVHEQDPTKGILTAGRGRVSARVHRGAAAAPRKTAPGKALRADVDAARSGFSTNPVDTNVHIL